MALIVKQNYLTSLVLIFCMVFSTSAAAFLHLNVHLHTQSDSVHHHVTDEHAHESEANIIGADHAHHFNLHVTGDLVEYDSIVFSKNASIFSCEFDSRLVSRTYTPPIPPPNA